MEIIGGSLTKNSLGAMKVAGSTAPGRRGGTSDRYIVVVFFVWGVPIVCIVVPFFG